MDFDIEIKTCVGGSIEIIDRSKEFGNYISEDATIQSSDTGFKYSQCVTIDLLKKIELDEEYLVGKQMIDHQNDYDPVKFIVDKDGYYINRHLLVPTLEWFNNCSEKQISEYDRVYVIIDNELYLFKGYTEEEEVIWESSDIDGLIGNINDTNILYIDIEFFYLGNLEECYMDYCKEILYGLMQGCKINKCKPVDNSDKIYARDFLWMVINVILYLVDFCLFLEAQRILELINYCGGFCKNVNKDEKCSCGCCAPKKSTGCGCSGKA